MKTFAVIEDVDADKLAFFTSFDTPDIRKEESRWKFQNDSAEVHTVPGEQEVVVDVGHFCFGLLAKRKRRSMFYYVYMICLHVYTLQSIDQKNFYMACLHKPVVLLPTCHAIFAVYLGHEVYEKVRFAL